MTWMPPLARTALLSLLLLVLAGCAVELGEQGAEPQIVGVKAELEASDPAEFELAAGRPQLVEFFAYWCGTCQAMAPLVHQLGSDYSGQIDFVYLDIDDPATAGFREALDYRLQPTYVLLDGEGQVVERWQGIVEREGFESAFGGLLEK